MQDGAITQELHICVIIIHSAPREAGRGRERDTLHQLGQLSWPWHHGFRWAWQDKRTAVFGYLHRFCTDFTHA